MSKVPARPAAAVPARPAQAPKPGTAAIPAQAKVNPGPATVTAPASSGISPIAGISQNDGGAPTAAVNQPGTTVAPVATVGSNAVTAEGQQIGIADPNLVDGAQVNVADGANPNVAMPKKRGRKKGSGAGGGGAPKKATYPGLLSVNEDGTPVMVDDGKGGSYQQRLVLGEIPTDFDFAKHEKLKPNDFQDEAVYCDFMAARFAALTKSWEKKAKRIRALGSAVDQKKALKFLKMREAMAKLAEQLKADGMDVDSLDESGEETNE